MIAGGGVGQNHPPSCPEGHLKVTSIFMKYAARTRVKMATRGMAIYDMRFPEIGGTARNSGQIPDLRPFRN